MADSRSREVQAQSRSLELFASGFNCAESVLMAVGEACGCATESTPKIATGFGGGIARQGETCGAVVGAVMAIGMLQGRERPDDERAREATYSAVGELIEGFRASHGTLCCRELTGCDLTTEEGRARAEQIDLQHHHCPKYVALAASLAVKAVEKH